MRTLPISAEAWSAARAALKQGSLVAFPTDTVYGVGCDPYNADAINAIFALKGRATTKAIPLLLSSSGQLEHITEEIPASARRLAQAYWPGALTLVVRRAIALPPELGGGDTIAVRVPDHDELRAWIGKSGGAIAATSANRSGEPDALTAAEVERYFGNSVEVIIDGGRVKGGVPSTVVNCVASETSILREGAVPEAEIRKTLKESIC
jgi:L-threonylcarbamoyladenylate synthase